MKLKVAGGERGAAAGIAGSRLETIARAGHPANRENPAAFSTSLRRFLADLG